MRTILVDNYDSFTYNVFDLLAEVNGVEPIVVRNDELTWPELRALEFDNVVISPGPGRPDRPRDFGVCADLISECEAPLLGICLGLQGLCAAHGAAVVPAPEPLHGRLSADPARRLAPVRRHRQALRSSGTTRWPCGSRCRRRCGRWPGQPTAS